jgi:hypothetical protein
VAHEPLLTALRPEVLLRALSSTRSPTRAMGAAAGGGRSGMLAAGSGRGGGPTLAWDGLPGGVVCGGIWRGTGWNGGGALAVNGSGGWTHGWHVRGSRYAFLVVRLAIRAKGGTDDSIGRRLSGHLGNLRARRSVRRRGLGAGGFLLLCACHPPFPRDKVGILPLCACRPSRFALAPGVIIPVRCWEHLRPSAFCRASRGFVATRGG